MSLIPNTYNGIVSAVKALAEDDSDEFENYIPTAIFLAEERLVKEVDTEGIQTSASIASSVSSNTLTKPDDHRLTHELYYKTSSGITQLIRKTDGFIRDYWPSETSVGQPKYYANKDINTWIVAPAFVSAYNVKVKYTAQVSSLSSSTQTNYYTDFAADALYYATMSNMAEFMKDYSVMQVWEGKYDQAIKTLNNQGRRDRRDDGSDPNNPESGINTLEGRN